MPQDAKCPKCDHTFPVTEARHAFTVACPRCETEMTAEFKKPAAPPEAGQPPYDLLVRKGALAGATAAPPAPTKKKPSDDEDDEPKRKGGSGMIVLLSGVLGLLFVVGGLGLTAWFLFTQIDMTETVSNRPNTTTTTKGPTTPKGPKVITNPEGDPFTPPPKKKDPTFDLRPVLGPIPQITSPDVPDGTPVGLPGKVGAITVGGAGRYIVMHFPDKAQLGVFDANTADITFVEADSGNVLLAAGLSRVVLYSPGANIMRVFSLPDLKPQFNTSMPGTNGLKAIAMGSRTNGPLLGIHGSGDPVLIELRDNDMREVEDARKERAGLHKNNLRAAPDGRAFATFDGFRPNEKTSLLTTENRQWKVQKDISQVPFFGTDGNLYGNGIVVDQRGQDQGFGGVGAGSGMWFVPATSGNGYFLKVVPGTLGTGAKAKKSIAVSVHNNRNSATPVNGTTPVQGSPEFDNLIDRNSNQPAVPYDQHLFLIPEAKLLITLTATKDKLVLRKLGI